MEVTKHRAAPAWWTHLVNGLLLLALGVATLLQHAGGAYHVLSIHFALVIVLNGALGCFYAWGSRHQLPGWGGLLALELAEVGLGVWVFTLPTGAPLRPALTSGWLLLRAALTLANAVALHRAGRPGWGWALAAGGAGGFFALVLLLSPHLYHSPLVPWLALGLCLSGLAGCVLAWQLRRPVPGQ